MRKTIHVLFYFLLVFVYVIPLISAEQKLSPQNGQTDDGFGRKVSLSGNYAIIGAPNDDNENGNDAGAVYIFFYNGSSWIEHSKLIASDGNEGDEFGSGVMIYENYAIIGAPGYDVGGENDAGTAYIFYFEGDTWLEQEKIVASDPDKNVRFGFGVGIYNDFAIVGSYLYNYSMGKAYIFHNTGSSWIEQDQLEASDKDFDSWFGYSVAIYGEFAIVGAPRNTILQIIADYVGSAYIFKYDSTTSEWTEQIQLNYEILPNVRESTAPYFGTCVDINENYAIVGCPLEDLLDEFKGENTNTGAAYIYHFDGNSWKQQAHLMADDKHIQDKFGDAVAIYGDYALVGAPYWIGNESYTGAVYSFLREDTAWTQMARLNANELESYGFFGTSCDLSQEHTIIGAGWDSYGNYESSYNFAFTYDNIEDCNLNHPPKIVNLPDVLILETNDSTKLKMSGYADDEDTPYEQLSWEFETNDPAVQTSYNESTDSLTIYSYGTTGEFYIYVTLTDNHGAYDKDTITVQVNATSNITIGINSLPNQIFLSQNFPNPFNSQTTIIYGLPEPSEVLLEIYNTTGQRILDFQESYKPAGYHKITFDTFQLSSGLYFYKISAGNYHIIKKMLLVK